MDKMREEFEAWCASAVTRLNQLKQTAESLLKELTATLESSLRVSLGRNHDLRCAFKCRDAVMKSRIVIG